MFLGSKRGNGHLFLGSKRGTMLKLGMKEKMNSMLKQHKDDEYKEREKKSPLER